MSSNSSTGSASTSGLNRVAFEGMLKVLREAEADSEYKARQAMRAVFKALGQDLDEGRTLLLPQSYREVVERLRSVPCMPKELQSRLQIDNIGILQGKSALSIDSSLFNDETSPIAPHFLRGLYNEK